jgi:hypothetical protein
VLPIFWVLANDASALQVGCGLAALGLGWVIGALLSVSVGQRFGARLTVIGGLIMAALALALTSLLVLPTIPILATIPSLWIQGVGMGMAYARISEAGLRDVPTTYTSQGSGLLIGMRLLGAGLGASLLAQFLLLPATITARDEILSSNTLADSSKEKIFDAISQVSRGNYGSLFADELKPTLQAATQDVVAAYSASTRNTLLVGSAILVGAAVGARRLPKPHRDAKGPAAAKNQ